MYSQDRNQAGQSRDPIKETDKLAVGLIVTADAIDETARAILRARSNGHPVLVIHRTEPTDEIRTFASQLGAQIVMPGGEFNDESLVEKLASESQRLGYPGVIVHSNLEKHIDYEMTSLEFERSDSYIVFARPKWENKENKTLAVIPAYNEGKSIEPVISQARSHVDTVLVIDDGSSDDTAERARKAGATVFEHDRNRGYGAALKTAFRQALRRDVDHLVILDGDGQHNPDDIPNLLARQRDSDAEIVVGSRFSSGSNTELPLYRRIGLWVVNTLVNMSMGRGGSKIRDTQSGFRAYNERAIRSLAKEQIGDHMDASIDVIHHAYRRGYQIEEVGTTIDYDVDNANSHNPFIHGFILVKSIIRKAGFERPLMVFGAPGFLVALTGLVMGLFLLLGYIPLALSSPVTAVLSSAAFLVGMVTCFWAIIMNVNNTNKND